MVYTVSMSPIIECQDRLELILVLAYQAMHVDCSCVMPLMTLTDHT